MTTRDLWQNIMHYGKYDRMPVMHWRGWPETRERWISEGLPADANEHDFFNTSRYMYPLSVKLDLFPAIEDEVIEETDEYRIFRDTAGVISREWKHKSSLPHYIDFTLKTAKDWDAYKKRLQPDPGRIPTNLDETIADAETSKFPVCISTGSLMGWVRNWMGVENMSYLMFDDQDVYADMVDTIAELTCWGIDQIVPRMNTIPDLAFGWEDICGKSGPLVSPNIFERCVSPGYLKVRAKLDEYGIPLLGIDSDGVIEPLLKLWLDAGVNLHFPIEIGTWNADPYELRQKFGKNLRILGGFNKLVLEKSPAEIDAEIQRRMPLMKEGGFILMPDHIITPGTSLKNYQYYLERVRELRF